MRVDVIGVEKKYHNFYLRDVSFTLSQGISALIGPSGSGKSTLAKILANAISYKGEVKYDGKNYNDYDFLNITSRVQKIFQNPSSSLNPRMKIKEIILEPLSLRGKTLKDRELIEFIEKLKLNHSLLSSYPHEISMGQKQKVALARSLILNPDFLIFDEITSSLDIFSSVEIVNLIKEMNKTVLFISHDLSIVRSIADRTFSISKGRVKEI